MIGQTISHYKILEKLGEGGMGVVYKAEDTKLDRTVALKFLPAHLASSEQDKARFVQEAKAAAALTHPNVCSIIDIQDHDGQMFIVMEFVDGQTLREKIGTLSVKQSIDIGIQIADGLAAAHEKGIVHRDIKPENIMVRKDGICQIMDFGLAKLRSASSKINRLTREGSTVGTAGYMSPEQIQGQDVDHRSDIFSFGVVLYEMFTGQLPFRGVHETALAYEIVNVDAAPMSTVKPDIDPNLDAIVLDCLEKDPKERCQSVAEVARSLRRVKRESSRQHSSRITAALSSHVPSKEARGEAKPSSTLPKERIFWIAALLVLTTVLLVKFFGTRENAATPVLSARFSIAPPEKTIIDGTSVSPDGKMVAFTATGEGRTLVWIRPLAALTPQPLSGTENASFPFWSTDSRYIGFFADGKLRKIDLSGGSPIAICDVSGGFGGAWNAAGEILFSDVGGLFRVASGGGVPKQVTFLDIQAKESSHRWPSFLPDGNRFLFVALRVSDEVATTYLTSMSDTSRIAILKSDANAIFAAPSNILFLSNRTLMSERFDLEKGTLAGEPHPVAMNVGYVPRLALGDFSYSTGGILTTGGGRSVNREYAWFNRSGQKIGVACQPGNYFDIALSPNGERAAVQRVDVQTNNSDIWTIDLSRSLLSRFTFDAAVEDYPIWSPDGRSIYFASAKGGTYNILRRASTGVGSSEDVTSPGFSQMPMDISSDGKHLLFQVLDPKTVEDIWVCRIDSARNPAPFLATEFSENYPRFSPDGRWVVYTSNESGKEEVYVQGFSTSGGRWQVSVNGGSQPRWRQDGGELFYVAPDLKLMAVQIKAGLTFDVGLAQPLFLTRIDSYDSPNRYVVAENGQKFLINIPVGDEFANPITVIVNPDL